MIWAYRCLSYSSTLSFVDIIKCLTVAFNLVQSQRVQRKHLTHDKPKLLVRNIICLVSVIKYVLSLEGLSYVHMMSFALPLVLYILVHVEHHNML